MLGTATSFPIPLISMPFHDMPMNLKDQQNHSIVVQTLLPVCLASGLGMDYGLHVQHNKLGGWPTLCLSIQ